MNKESIEIALNEFEAPMQLIIRTCRLLYSKPFYSAAVLIESTLRGHRPFFAHQFELVNRSQNINKQLI